MAQTHTDTNVNQLVINKMTKQEYDNLSQVSDTELYLVEEQVDSVVTENSTNPVQSGAVYEALQDIGGAINDGTTLFTKNNKTIGVISANQALDKTIKIPNDIIMCKMSDGIVYDSYITYTKVKQYLPDYPYYSDDLNWEIGGNPPMRANITEGDYYLDVDTNHIFIADENLELQDVTSTVVIQGDTNKLYCDVTTNMLYRYDGTDFVPLTSEGKTYTLSSNNENIRLTDSDGQTQDLSLNTLINGLSVGTSDPADNDYIISQYVNGGTTTTTYHRRPLSNFWNWIKTKLGIGTNDGTFLRKDGTWATPTATIYLGIATGNSLIAFIKTKISNGYKVGYFSANGSNQSGCPDATNTWIIQYQCDTSIGNAIQLMAWCYGSAWAIRRGYAWNNTNNEPSWKVVAIAEDYVAKTGDTVTGTLILSRTQDASGTANNKPALIVGGTDTQAHIEIDCNEIIAKSNGTTGDKLWLQDGYGALGLVGSDYSVSNPDKFLTALGSGLTSKSYNTSGGSCTVYKWGRICMVSFSTSISSSSGTMFTIADAAYRPLTTVRTVCQASVSSTAVFYTAVSINTGGAITYLGTMYRNGTNNVVGNESSSRPIEGTICYISAS